MEDHELKDRILSNTKELFLRYGIRSISMDDIARHLGISKKTIYLHFTDKNDIIKQSLALHLASERSLLKTIQQEGPDSLYVIMEMNRCWQKHLLEITSSLLFELQKYHVAAWHMAEKHKKEFVYVFVKEVLQQGVASGLFREDMHVPIVAKLWLEDLLLPHNEEVFSKNEFPLKDIADSILDQFIYGITTDKGKKLYKKYKPKFTS